VKSSKFASGACLHNTDNKNGLRHFDSQLQRFNSQCVTNQKNVLLVEVDGIKEQGWKCLDTSNLTFRIDQSKFVSIKD